MRRPVHRRDRRPHRAQPPQLRAHHHAHERADLLAHLVHAAERRQRDALVRRAAEEEGVVEGAVLRERVGRPSLEVGAELAGVAGDAIVLLEVVLSDGCSEEQEGLRGV